MVLKKLGTKPFTIQGWYICKEERQTLLQKLKKSFNNYECPLQKADCTEVVYQLISEETRFANGEHSLSKLLFIRVTIMTDSEMKMHDVVWKVKNSH